MNKIEFINAYKKYFLENNELKLIFQMGGSLQGKKRMAEIIKRFQDISSYVFKDKEVWVLLVLWNGYENAWDGLLNSGFDVNLAQGIYHGDKNDGLIKIESFAEDAFDSAEILYLQYEKFNFNDVIPLVYSSAGYDLGWKNAAGILCYFISFDVDPVFLNLYDDRGMEFLCHNTQLIEKVGNGFGRYLFTRK